MTTRESRRDGHAVVLGGSLAGLLAATVLQRRFVRVTIVERDELADAPESRKGVPQGRHAHALLAAGERVIEGLLPGLVPELLAGGSVRAGMLADGRWWQFDGYRVTTTEGDIRLVFASRPYLEATVRRRVVALDGIAVVRGVARGLVVREDRVVGADVEGDEPGVIDADLVVDATGRGSHVCRWLAGAGFPSPPVSEVRIDMGYASRLVRRTPGRLPDSRWFGITSTPPARRLAVAFPVEGNRWLVTLAGFHGDHAPTDEDGYLAFARSLPTPEIAELLSAEQALTPIRTHRLASNQRRHFERVRRMPAGFVAIGDAICSFDPIYGQGMSSAALQAVELGRAVDEVGAASPRMPRRFYRRASAVVRNPWQIAAGGDFMLGETAGRRPPMVGAINKYLRCVFIAAQRDAVVAGAVIEVQNLLAPPALLMRPSIALRSLRATRGRRTRLQAAPPEEPRDDIKGGIRT